MNCQTLSTGLSSGHFCGSGKIVMLAGTTNFAERCHPAWSIISTPCLPDATLADISVRCRFIARVLQQGRIRPAALPSCGQIAPKM